MSDALINVLHVLYHLIYGILHWFSPQYNEDILRFTQLVQNHKTVGDGAEFESVISIAGLMPCVHSYL